MRSFVIVRASLAELLGRRLLLWGVVISAAFLGLFLTGLVLIKRQLSLEELVGPVGSLLAILALYIVSFLGSFLALVLSVGSVSSEVESGLIHSVLARPITRRSWLGQRWAAIAGLVGTYTVVMAAAVMVIANGVMGYQPVSATRALLLMAFQTLAMASIGLMLSTRLSTVPAGVTLFALFGLAWLAGVLEFIGNGIANRSLVNIGIAVSLIMPTDALWKGASYYASGSELLSQTAGVGGLPFSSSTPPAGVFVVWAIAYTIAVIALAHRRFARRDL